MPISANATFSSVEKEVGEKRKREGKFSPMQKPLGTILDKNTEQVSFFSIYTGSFWTLAFKANFSRRKLVTLSSGNVIAA